MPSARNPQGGSDKLIDHIDKLDILRERYSQAIEYMAWFAPAWSSLTDNQKSGATYRLMDRLSYSKSHIERLRSKALNRLRSLLYGI